ncbi:sucrase ferredoxin [Micromonospora sp. DT4]|uniref:sucrase ferredoxin n=1 Tax=Micromonospora sp. DT4 TaxID=3393438 RepID=UPI003CEA4111
MVSERGDAGEWQTAPPTPPDELCAKVARWAEDLLAGTTPTTTSWLAVEQPGPWGRDAATLSRLDPVLGAHLAAAAQDRGMRLLLIRRPSQRGFDEPGGRRVLMAHTRPGSAWLESIRIEDDSELRHLDLDGLAAGRPSGHGHRTDPVALVCTNAKRDRCCAVFGRALLRDLSDSRTAEVWECSHLGGHRFAPTALVLPHGYMYGWLTPDLLDDALAAAAAHRLDLRRLRGRSTWTAAGQVAELAIRQGTGDHDPNSLVVVELPDRSVLVSHRDRQRWIVKVAPKTGGRRRPKSCGQLPDVVSGLVVERILRIA